jgi:hypothetical protein
MISDVKEIVITTDTQRSGNMTIEDHIEVLKSYHHGFTGCAGNLQDSINVAVDIMCKYQKIEQILKEWGDKGLLQNQLYELIRKVVEDGNNE